MAFAFVACVPVDETIAANDNQQPANPQEILLKKLLLKKKLLLFG
jgi:hypothetical protein